MPDEIPTFLYVGGDSYIKGFHILLKSITQLGRKKIRARFLLTNRYSHESYKILQQLTYKFPTINVEIIGRVPYNEILKLHRSTWALLFPSIWEEPLPYAVIESMALGTIPISCKVGGVPEVVKRSIAEAYLLEPCDSATLVDKITELSSIGKNDLIEIALRLRNHALNLFNEKYIETKLASLFSQLLDGSNLEPTL